MALIIIKKLLADLWSSLNNKNTKGFGKSTWSSKYEQCCTT